MLTDPSFWRFWCFSQPFFLILWNCGNTRVTRYRLRTETLNNMKSSWVNPFHVQYKSKISKYKFHVFTHFRTLRIPNSWESLQSSTQIKSIQVAGFAADEKYRQGRTGLSFADIYHSANRYGTGERAIPIVLPRSMLWSFEQQRLVLGRESLALQGHTVDPEILATLETTEGQLQDLAGNSLVDNHSKMVMIWWYDMIWEMIWYDLKWWYVLCYVMVRVLVLNCLFCFLILHHFISYHIISLCFRYDMISVIWFCHFLWHLISVTWYGLICWYEASHEMILLDKIVIFII